MGTSTPTARGWIASGRSGYDPADAPRFAFQYGYVEMRARVPAGRGFWSASGCCEPHRVLPWEIDIFEILGHQPNIANMTVHYPHADGSTDANGDAYAGPDFTAGYHIYALEWSAEQLVWYIDGVERKRESNAAHIPHDPMYLIANPGGRGRLAWPTRQHDVGVSQPAERSTGIRVWQRAQ